MIAVSQSRQVYYTKLDKVKWQDTWGKPIAKSLYIPEKVRAWGVAHRWGKQLSYYEDIIGKKHFMGAGVTTLYILSKDGHDIYYTDPWLPPQFSHNVSMPLRGRFIAQNMAVSASTLFVINQVGEMFTRLYDFDTSGQNPFLKYTYDTKTKKDIRTLPAEPWYKQPRIRGNITNVITILQTEKGNAARELRVEGISHNNTGYYYKRIYAKKWSFRKTGHKLVGNFLDNNINADRSNFNLLSKPKTRNYKGTISQLGTKRTISVTLIGYSPYHSPAALRFVNNKEQLDIPIHFRQIYPFKSQTKFLGMMILPEKQNKPIWFKKIHREFFKKKGLVLLKIVETNKEIILKSDFSKTFRQSVIRVDKLSQ